jgi:hypothetical protein
MTTGHAQVGEEKARLLPRLVLGVFGSGVLLLAVLILIFADWWFAVAPFFFALPFLWSAIRGQKSAVYKWLASLVEGVLYVLAAIAGAFS